MRSLTTKDVAALLGTTTEAVHKLVQSGTLKAHRRGKGSRYVFDSQSVYLERLRRSGRARRAS